MGFLPPVSDERITYESVTEIRRVLYWFLVLSSETTVDLCLAKAGVIYFTARQKIRFLLSISQKILAF
jgi:hypothetical protein